MAFSIFSNSIENSCGGRGDAADGALPSSAACASRKWPTVPFNGLRTSWKITAIRSRSRCHSISRCRSCSTFPMKLARCADSSTIEVAIETAASIASM
eukprot:scaffold13618_cov66-Phaeocystis_antarctica.AAC.4